MSQLDLAHAASVSPRHISFLETSRSRPSREMLLHLAAALNLPMRSKNEMLAAAGFPPTFLQSPLEEGALDSGVLRALDLILENHEPFPVFVMDRHFDIVRSNQSAKRFLNLICKDPSLLSETPNGYLVFLHPDLGRDSIVDWPEVAALLVGLLHRNVLNQPDNRFLRDLLDEALALPDINPSWQTLGLDAPSPAVFTFHFRCAGFKAEFLTTLTTFIAPNNITLEELSIESYYPLDESSSQACDEVLRLTSRPPKC